MCCFNQNLNRKVAKIIKIVLNAKDLKKLSNVSLSFGNFEVHFINFYMIFFPENSYFRSGRVCVLDSSIQALQTLYNSEFMPYVVVIAPPAFDELQQMCKLRGEKCQKTDEELKSTCEQNATLMKSEFAKYFDLVLVVSFEFYFKYLFRTGTTTSHFVVCSIHLSTLRMNLNGCLQSG